MTESLVSIVDPLIPIREAFTMVGIRPTKGYEEVRASRLRAIRNGPRQFIRASEVRRYIEALETASLNRGAV